MRYVKHSMAMHQNTSKNQKLLAISFFSVGLTAQKKAVLFGASVL